MVTEQQRLVNVLANIHNSAEKVILAQLTIGAMSLMIGNSIVDSTLSSREVADILMEARNNKYEHTPISNILYRKPTETPKVSWFKRLFHNNK